MSTALELTPWEEPEEDLPRWLTQPVPDPAYARQLDAERRARWAKEDAAPSACADCRQLFEHGNFIDLHRSCASILSSEIGRPAAPFVRLAMGDK